MACFKINHNSQSCSETQTPFVQVLVIECLDFLSKICLKFQSRETQSLSGIPGPSEVG